MSHPPEKKEEEEEAEEAEGEPGSCILTAENMATEDDCTTHEHVPWPQTRKRRDEEFNEQPYFSEVKA